MSDNLFEDAVLVDTDVISYFFKKDSRDVLYKRYIEGKLAIMAAQTFAELQAWPLNNKWSVKRHEQLRKYIENNFVFVEVTKEICLEWAQIMADAKKRGYAIAIADAWIAATALAYSIPLVTHNYRDFKNDPA